MGTASRGFLFLAAYKEKAEVGVAPQPVRRKEVMSHFQATSFLEPPKYAKNRISETIKYVFLASALRVVFPQSP
jgi:hypothetical protein